MFKCLTLVIGLLSSSFVLAKQVDCWLTLSNSRALNYIFSDEKLDEIPKIFQKVYIETIADYFSHPDFFKAEKITELKDYLNGRAASFVSSDVPEAWKPEITKDYKSFRINLSKQVRKALRLTTKYDQKNKTKFTEKIILELLNHKHFYWNKLRPSQEEVLLLNQLGLEVLASENIGLIKKFFRHLPDHSFFVSHKNRDFMPYIELIKESALYAQLKGTPEFKKLIEQAIQSRQDYANREIPNFVDIAVQIVIKFDQPSAQKEAEKLKVLLK